jgi:hypothetical protein
MRRLPADDARALRAYAAPVDAYYEERGDLLRYLLAPWYGDIKESWDFRHACRHDWGPVNGPEVVERLETNAASTIVDPEIRRTQARAAFELKAFDRAKKPSVVPLDSHARIAETIRNWLEGVGRFEPPPAAATAFYQGIRERLRALARIAPALTKVLPERTDALQGLQEVLALMLTLVGPPPASIDGVASDGAPPDPSEETGWTRPGHLGISLNSGQMAVRRAGRPGEHRLTPILFRVLEKLLAQKGSTCPHERLRDAWEGGMPPSCYTSTICNLNKIIMRLGVKAKARPRIGYDLVDVP